MLQSYVDCWGLENHGLSVQVCSLPGVFAHGRLDRGTDLLLEVLEKLEPEGSILDFACGAGVIGLSLLGTSRARKLTLLDAFAPAVVSARRSLEVNGLTADVLASDGFSELTGRFDWIVSNLPFHRGVKNDLEVARNFFRRSGTFLVERGKIVVVFNRHLPYNRWISECFSTVNRLADRNDYKVVCASGPLSQT